MKLNSKEVIEKRDLLKGINPFIGYLIKALNIADEEIKGIAMYELMTFRNR
jgi:hypothetical protein